MQRRLIVGLGCLGFIVIIALTYAIVAGPGGESAASRLPAPLPRATATPLPEIESVPPDPTSTPMAMPTATERATSTPNPLVIANTGGLGLAIRRAPVSGERISVWAEGTTLQVVGEDRSVEGMTWKNVRDPAGNVGWAPEAFLVAPSERGISLAATPIISSTPTPTSVMPVTAPPPPERMLPRRGVRLLTARAYRLSGHAVVEGDLCNEGDVELRSVWVAVEWYAADGEIVKSQAAPIKRDPLLPAQTSAFRVVAVDDATIESYDVEFYELSGGPIPLVNPS